MKRNASAAINVTPAFRFYPPDFYKNLFSFIRQAGSSPPAGGCRVTAPIRAKWQDLPFIATFSNRYYQTFVIGLSAKWRFSKSNDVLHTFCRIALNFILYNLNNRFDGKEIATIKNSKANLCKINPAVAAAFADTKRSILQHRQWQNYSG